MEANSSSIGSIVIKLLERDKIRFVCWSVLGLSSLILALSLATSRGGRTILGSNLGSDYAGFYTAGTLLNQYPAERLYDLDLQDELFHQLLPEVPLDQKLPFVYPPFFSLVFRPFALLPYTWSYLAWLVFSIAIFMAGFRLLRSSLREIPEDTWGLALLLSLSFEPLVMESWLGGQTSVIGFFFMSLALYWHRLGRAVPAGVALAGCLYKPVFLLLIVPMLLVGRRAGVLAGFLLGSAALVAVSLLTIGYQGCADYVLLLLRFGRATGQSDWVFPAWKFVDLNSFLRLLREGGSRIDLLIVAAASALAIPFLAREWWQLGRRGTDHRDLTWACTITWTLVFNLYVGIYDTVLVVLSVHLTAACLFRRMAPPGTALVPAFRTFLVLLYVAPWFSQHAAMTIGLQPYTLILAALGAYQLRLARTLASSAELKAPAGE
jgi:hypothetical protein